MKQLLTILLLSSVCLMLSGCLEPRWVDPSALESPPIFGPAWLDSMIEIAQALSIANAASAPVNPYVFPIGVGLAGLTTMLEALRRKEKAGRKHAEAVLNGNNNKG